MENLRTLAIIGTAGRGDAAKILNRRMYDGMVRTASGLVGELRGALLKDGQELALVSGGAAWADHVAVTLFLQEVASALTLHLPAQYDESTGRFEDTGVVDWRTNPGGTANYYHRKFSQHLGRDTLAEIGEAMRRGAIGHVGKGFFGRNDQVAGSDAVIAMTLGKGCTLNKEERGTSDTFKKYLNRCAEEGVKPIAWHVSLAGAEPELFPDAALEGKTAPVEPDLFGR